MSTEEPTTETEASEENDEAKKKNWSFYITLAVTTLLMLCTKAFVADVFYIPSESMEPTLHGVPHDGGDRIVVDKIGLKFSDPKPGDIVVFNTPDRWDQKFKGEAFVKRVIAVGGQTIAIDEDGNMTVDGRIVEEPYLGSNYAFEKGILDCKTSPRSQRCFPEITVPEGSVWLMGDNRKSSMDSTYGCRGTTTPETCQGPVPVDHLIGRAKYVFFPFSRGKSL